MAFGAVSPLYSGTMADMAPTPRPAMNRPTHSCGTEWFVAVWMITPTVKMPDQTRMEPRRPMESEVKACASAPTKVLEKGCQKRCYYE